MIRTKSELMSGSDGGLLRGVFSKYFMSSMFAILFSTLGQITNGIVTGNLIGETKLAVMSLVLPLYYVFATIGNMAGIGGSTLCASLVGERRSGECKKAFTATYLLTLLLSVAFTALFLCFLPGIVKLLGTGDALYDDVMSYAVIMIAGGVFTAGIYLSFNFLRLDNRSVATILTFVIMAVVNIVLDIVFVAVFNWGLAGISLATTLGAIAATVYGIVLLLAGKGTLGFERISISEFFGYTGKIFRVGSPGATENASILIRSYLLNNLITAFVGTAALSSLSVVNSVNSFALAIIAGGSGALIPLVGVLSPERDTQGIKRVVKSTIFICGIILIAFIAVVAVFAPQAARLFGITSDSGVYATARAIRIFCLSLPPSLIVNILIYLHLTNRHTVIANILTVSRCLVLSIAAAIPLMFIAGETGLWFSFAACEFGTIVLAAILHFSAKSKKPELSYLLLLDEQADKSGAALSCCVTDTEEDIMRCVASLEKFCEDNELSPKRSMLVTLSMEEMLMSIREHSLKGTKDRIISARVLIYEDVLVLRMRHGGKKFNPIEYYENKQPNENDLDALLELDDSLGIKMILDACDVVDYRTTFGINNLTVII